MAIKMHGLQRGLCGHNWSSTWGPQVCRHGIHGPVIQTIEGWLSMGKTMPQDGKSVFTIYFFFNVKQGHLIHFFNHLFAGHWLKNGHCQLVKSFKTLNSCVNSPIDHTIAPTCLHGPSHGCMDILKARRNTDIILKLKDLWYNPS